MRLLFYKSVPERTTPGFTQTVSTTSLFDAAPVSMPSIMQSLRLSCMPAGESSVASRQDSTRGTAEHSPRILQLHHAAGAFPNEWEII